MDQLSALSTQLYHHPLPHLAEPPPADAAALCFVLDDEPSVGWLMITALTSFGVAAEHFTSAPAMLDVLGHRTPEIIFLDLFVGDADAIDILSLLARMGYGGAVQIMSSRETALLDDVRRVGARYGLRMLPVLPKPFRLDALKRIVEREQLVPSSVPARGAEKAVVAGRSPQVDLG